VPFKILAMVMIIKTGLCEPCEGLLVIVTTRVMDIFVEWNGIKQCLLCFFMSLTVGTIHNLIYKLYINSLRPSVCDGARVRHRRTTGPGPAKTGEGLTGCDGGQHGRAGHGRVPAGPVRLGTGEGLTPGRRINSLGPVRAGHGRGVDSRKKNQFVQNQQQLK
jgi:hypothetical protein